MSYILDALNKSEEKRSAQHQPDTGIAGKPAQQQPGRDKRWLIILLGGLLLSGGLIWSRLMLPDEHKPAIATTSAVVPTPNTPQISPASSAPPPDDLMGKKIWLRKQLEPTVLEQSPIPAAVVPAIQDTNEAEQLQASIIPHDVKVSPHHEDDTYANIPDRSQLSAMQQAAVPAIRIEGHVYDKIPAARMVIINEQLRREGQPCGNGLMLEEITTDGVILSHNGTVFHIGTFDR